MSRPALATDETLARRARSGDRDALTELTRRHRPMLVEVCTRHAHSDGEDAAQQVLADLPRRLATYDPNRSPLSTWLRVVAKHEAIRTARRRDRCGDLHVDHVDHAALAAPGADPAVRVITAESVRTALEGVSPDARFVLVASCLHGRSDPELASLLGLDPITIRTMRSKARANIRARVAASD